MSGPVQIFCDHLHATKYRAPGETHHDCAVRISTHLADDYVHEKVCLEILSDMRFMPAGRVQAWAGSPKVVTPYNCYVSPIIHDSFVDGPKGGPFDDPNSVSIMDAVKLAAQTMRQGGGIGYDFSTLRPSGDIINGVQSTTDGPIGFMPIFDATCRATSSAGNRRGAQMGVLRVDHPDIEKFIMMKTKNDFLSGFNVSIGVTDEFMNAVEHGLPFDLRFNGKVYRTVDARELWDLIMRTAYDWAEPGVLFLDTINRMNNLHYCETITATNPCGEQPLPPYGACLLGSFLLTKYLIIEKGYPTLFDWNRFIADIPPVVRMMDNVIDKATYPLPQQAEEAKTKRRMGLGVTGLANALEAMGLPYGSAQFVAMEAAILKTLRDTAYRASVELAKEKGSFPMLDRGMYLESGFAKTLPDDIRAAILEHGIRNSHLTSIAPTGTISFTADNVSSSIEPVFALEQERPVKMPDGEHVVNLQDYGLKFLGVKGKTTAQTTVKEHLDVLLTAAQYVDSAVSKTINVDGHISWADFVGIYWQAYKGGAKGCTVFNKDGKRWGLIKDKDEDGGEAAPEPVAAPETGVCQFDPETGRKSCE